MGYCKGRHEGEQRLLKLVLAAFLFAVESHTFFQIPVMQAEQICALFGTVEAVIRVIRRGQVYELLYTADTTGVDAADNLDTALLGVYKASIELLAESDTLFSQGMAKQTLRAVLRPKHAEGLTADLFKAEQHLAHEAQACESMRNAKAGSKLDSRMSDMEDLLRPLDPLLTRTDTAVSKVLKRVEAEEYDKLVEFSALFLSVTSLILSRERGLPGQGNGS